MELTICIIISCFITAKILFLFMNKRYNEVLKYKYIYWLIEAGVVILTCIVALTGNTVCDLLIWIVVAAACSGLLYYGNIESPIRRISECSVLLLFLRICEFFSMVMMSEFLKVLHIEINRAVMQTCLEIIFSKVVMICMYCMMIGKLMKTQNDSFEKIQYIVNGIIIIYSLMNLLVIAEGLEHSQSDHILTISMVCMIVSDLYLLYFAKVIYEKNALKSKMKALENQVIMQQGYYAGQVQKYSKTVQILHDVNKHIRSIEQLYVNGDIEYAAEYTNQIGEMLKPLLPFKYTKNPILDILLSDKMSKSRDNEIDFKIEIGDVNLDFIHAIDVSTIFGNLLDNAMEACESVIKDRRIHMQIDAYHEMITIRVENSCSSVKWRNGMPISEKGEDRGRGLLNVKKSIEKYDGDMKMYTKNGLFVVDLFMNS